MKLSIQHQTEYHYDAPVLMGLQRLRLRPNSNSWQDVNAWQINVEGAGIELDYRDQYDNHVELVKLNKDTQSVLISVQGEVETHNNSGIFGKDAVPLPSWFYKGVTPLTKTGTELKKLVRAHQNNDGSAAFFHDLMIEIREHVEYKTSETEADTTAEEAWKIGAGVCQDHAHIMIAVSRALGYEARYVSGYLLMNETIEQSASHAWCEVKLDGLGWVGFDVSNGYSPDERYARLAIGRDYQDAAPIHGLRYGQSKEVLDVRLQIQQ